MLVGTCCSKFRYSKFPYNDSP